MNHEARTVRAATEVDMAAILDLTVAAMRPEPVLGHLFPGSYDECARGFFGYLLAVRLLQGEVWAAEVDGRVLAASLWDLPGHAAESDALWAKYSAGLPDGAVERIDRYDALVHEFAPRSDHYYLGVFAAHPDAQGRGHGAAVLLRGLDLADAAGVPTFLETGTEANLDYYRRFGFAVSGEAELDADTTVWCLTRVPGGYS